MLSLLWFAPMRGPVKHYFQFASGPVKQRWCSAPKYIYIQGLYSIFNINMIVRHQKVLLNPKAGTHWDDAKRIGDLKQQHMGVKNCNSKTGLMITLKSTMPNLQILCIQPERPYIYIYITLYIYIYIYILAWYSLASKPFKELAHARLQHYDVYKPWWV